MVAASAVLLVGLSSYLEALTRLDSQFIDLQKRAFRTAQVSFASEQTAGRSQWSGLRERFFEPGTLQDPLVLATRVQTALKSSGLSVLESRVSENSASAQWVQYHVEGDIQSWFHFLQTLRGQDSRVLFRSLSLVRKQQFTYSVSFEAGHVVRP
jgi:hypothetical protein